MEKHKEELLIKSGMDIKDFNEILGIILKKVIIIPEEVLFQYRDEALEIIRDIELDDVLFIACALAYNDSIIWSDDKKLKEQTKIKIINTNEFIELLKWKTD